MLGLRITGGLPLALLSVLIAGCLEGIDKPTPPATPATVTSMDAPTGSLTEATFAVVLDGLSTLASDYEALCGWDPVTDLTCLEDGTCSGCVVEDLFFDLLRDLLPSLAGSADGGVEIENISGVNGYVDVVRICAGFDVPSPDPGRMQATVGFTGHGVDPVVWGSVDACQFTLLGQDLTVNGSYGFHYEERVPFALVASTPVIFAFDGTIASGASVMELSLALRLRPDGTGDKELLVDLGAQGTFVFVVTPAGVYVRAADGYFSCNVVTETCQAS